MHIGILGTGIVGQTLGLRLVQLVPLASAYAFGAHPHIDPGGEIEDPI